MVVSAVWMVRTDISLGRFIHLEDDGRLREWLLFEQMLLLNVVPHVGQYCEVVTRNDKFFGELIRLSSVGFLVRPKWPSNCGPEIVEAEQITAIVDLPNPHF